MPETQGPVAEGYLGRVIHDAKQIGELGPASTWAFVSIMMVAYLWKLTNQQKKADDKWQDIRTQQAIAEDKLADALQKMADEVGKLRIVVDERLPRRR